MFPSAIEIGHKNSNGSIENTLFASFKNRNETYQLMKKYCSHYNPQCDDEEEQSNTQQEESNADVKKFEESLEKRKDTFKLCSFSMSAKEYFNTFLSDESKLPFDVLYKLIDSKIISETKWEKVGNNQMKKLQVIDYAIKGVPFIKSSITNKTSVYTEYDDKIVIEDEAKQPKMMLGDHFYCVSSTEIFDLPKLKSCVVRWNFEIKMLKPTMFEGMIKDRSLKETHDFLNLWYREATNRNLITSTTAHLNHSVEEAFQINSTKSRLSNLISFSTELYGKAYPSISSYIRCNINY